MVTINFLDLIYGILGLGLIVLCIVTIIFVVHLIKVASNLKETTGIINKDVKAVDKSIVAVIKSVATLIKKAVSVKNFFGEKKSKSKTKKKSSEKK